MKQSAQASVPSPRRVGVAEARSRLSEVLRDAAKGPTIIRSRGRDLAVLLALDEHEQLGAEPPGVIVTADEERRGRPKNTMPPSWDWLTGNVARRRMCIWMGA